MFRVADPNWADPLDPSFASTSGGRWNPPGGFGVLYLCGSESVARANLARLYVGLSYGPEDLDPDAAPVLASVEVMPDDYVDAVTPDGLLALGLPVSYPIDLNGRTIDHSICRPIGLSCYTAGEPGIACRSAAVGADGEELAWFAHPNRKLPTIIHRRGFDDWFAGIRT